MLIIMDYDETYTASPSLWDEFINIAQDQGHTIVCCTNRPSGNDVFNSDVISDMEQHDIEIIYAAEHQDKWEAVQKAGYVPEDAIWIDDRPMYIFLNRSINELLE